MAKEKGPQDWKIPSEDEVKDLYGDDEKLEQQVARANELKGDGTHKKTFEEQLEERKSNFYLMGMILLGVIIIVIVASFSISIINAGKKVENMEDSVENQNQLKQSADIEDENGLPEGENNFNQYGYDQTQPMTQPYGGVYPTPQQTEQPMPQSTPEAYPQPVPQATPQPVEPVPSQTPQTTEQPYPAPTPQSYPQGQ